MLKKFASALAVMLAFIFLPCAVFALGDEITAAAFASPGYDGDEKNTFAPADSYNVASFPIGDENWNFSGLSSRSGVNTKNNITYVYSIVDRVDTDESDKNYTELNIDLSSFRCNMSDYSTFLFGIAIYGASNIHYTVTAALYSGNDRVVGEALTGIGWNLFCLDVSNATGIASHIKITIHYDDEIPFNIRISSPYATKTLNYGFEMSEKYFTYRLEAVEGNVVQKVGKIKPEKERAVIDGNFVDVKNQLHSEAGSTVYFELKLSGVTSGNFTLGLNCDDTSETVYSKKISLDSSGENCVVVIPMTLSGRILSYSLVFDNIKCDVTFTLEYIKIHKINSAPAAAVSGIGSLSKITRASDRVVFSGSMERAAVSEYSSAGDGLIHFYALHSSDMGDISKATELGSIKLTTVFEYTVKLSGFPEVGEAHMFFAATVDREGNIYPLSRPRFADADLTADISSYPGSSGVKLGLFDPATVGAFESNVSSVIIDVPLDEFLLSGDYRNLSPQSVSFNYTVYGDEAQNRTLEFDRERLGELDNDIAFYTSAGIRVYLRLNACRAVENLTYSALTDCESYAFRADSEESRAMFAAIVRFFAKRYPGIRGFELGLASNVYSYIGEKITSAADYVSYLAELCRICYNAASPELGGMSVILPFQDTAEMSADEYIPIETIAVMLTCRLNEIGQIPLVFLYSFDDESSTSRITDAARLMGELECGNFSGIMYFYRPGMDVLEKKYSEYTTDAFFGGISYSDMVPYTEFAAQSFASLADKLNDERTVGVYFSMEDTNLKNSHDFYSVLKHTGEGIGYVCDTAAVPIALTTDKNAAEAYVLCDFSDKYHTDGWIAGGGVESCSTDWSTVNWSTVNWSTINWSAVFTSLPDDEKSGDSGKMGSSRVLSVQFRQDDYYGKTSGTAGIALYNFPSSVDMTKVDSAVFTIAIDGASEIAKAAEYTGNTVVFVIGTDDTRAEYYAEGLECGKTYSFECSLGEYENREKVDYIGIMVYSDVELRLELSSVALFSEELGAEGIGELFEERETAPETNYKAIALFSFTVAAFSIMVFVFLAKLEREEEENDVKNNRANGYSTSNGGANGQKYRRQ